MKNVKELLQDQLKQAEDKIGFLNTVREWVFEVSPMRAQPVDFVRWVPVEKVECNDYNPNAVAKTEMKLLLHSIESDGFTQPIVVMWNSEHAKYTVVDGFHRYTVCRENEEIKRRCLGHVPIVVLDKDIAERMASTVRHNRARGKHSIAGMANLVFLMCEEGRTDSEICKDLGMEPDEILRLKHITGFSKLFENVEYRKSWETSKMLRIRMDYEKAHPGEKTADMGRKGST